MQSGFVATYDCAYGRGRVFQALEKWPRRLFVDSDRALEALDFFLKTGKQDESQRWVRTDAFPREIVWETREGREAWERGSNHEDRGARRFAAERGATTAKIRRLPAVHPGEVLSEDLMTPLRLSINGLARDLRMPVTRVSEIVNGRRSITDDTALRLARYFAMTPFFWMNLEAAYDLDVTMRASADRIRREVHPPRLCSLP